MRKVLGALGVVLMASAAAPAYAASDNPVVFFGKLFGISNRQSTNQERNREEFRVANNDKAGISDDDRADDANDDRDDDRDSGSDDDHDDGGNDHDSDHGDDKGGDDRDDD